MFLEEPEVGILIPIDLILAWQFIYRYETHTAQESGLQLQCSVLL